MAALVLGGGGSSVGALVDAFVQRGTGCVEWALWPSDGASGAGSSPRARWRGWLLTTVRWWRAAGGLVNGSINLAPARTGSTAPPRSPPLLLPTAAHARRPYHALPSWALVGGATAQLSRDVAAVRLGGGGHVSAWIASALSLPVRCVACRLPAQTNNNARLVSTPSSHRTLRNLLHRLLKASCTPPVRPCCISQAAR